MPCKQKFLDPPFYKKVGKAAVAITFDYETSAVSPRADILSLIKRNLRKSYYKIKKTDKDLSGIYGRGYANRIGAENILALFQKYNIHGTWFATGHCLLKENKKRQAFRINQALPYMTEERGFEHFHAWRQKKKTFWQEPYSDYKHYPYWYLGDQTEKLRESGEDIQCHSFSHPYIPLELVKNIRVDIEDWQHAAVDNHFEPAIALAFPYMGDIYRDYHQLGLKAHPRLEITGEPYKDILLSNQVLELLKENGIQLLTRCGSKVGQSMKAAFQPYEDSEIYYIQDLNFNPSSPCWETIKLKLDECIEHQAALDIWMHPNDVFTKEEVVNFEKLIQLLMSDQYINRLWIGTIREIWEQFQSCQPTV